MAHVRRRNDAWYIVVGGREVSGRTVIGRPFTREEAEAHMARVAGEVAADRREGTFGGWLERWLLEQRSQLRETTWEGYARRLRADVPASLESLPLGMLTTRDINELYMGMLVRGLAASTVRQTHSIVQKALTAAVAEGRLAANPCFGATVPRAEEPETRTWSPDELRSFLAAAQDDDWYALWVVAVTTGLRRGEVLGLQHRDLHLDESYLEVRRNVTWTGKRIVVQPPKTRKGVRPVALDDWTVAALSVHTVAHPEEPWLWVDGSEPPDPTMLNRRFNKLVKRAGLPPLRFHDVRHSHATAALVAGAPLRVMTERLGHHDPGFTARRYQHGNLAMQREVADGLARLLFADVPEPRAHHGAGDGPDEEPHQK